MSQHDMDLLTGNGAAVRADLNLALKALASQSSGAADPATQYAFQRKARTDLGVIMRRNAANNGNILDGTLAETLLITRAANTVLAIGDFARIIAATGSWTQTFNAAATLGDGWFVEYRNDGTGVITLDPNAAETIDGATTIQLAPGETCCVYCDGTQFKTIGRSSLLLQNQTVTAFTTGGTSTAYTLTPTPAIAANAANQRFRVKFNAAPGTNPTLAASGQTALPLKYRDATNTLQAITSAQVLVNWISDLESDGTNWVVLNPAGMGDYISSTIAQGSPVSLTNATNANVTSITLPPGDWHVSAVLGLAGNAATTMSYLGGSISNNSLSIDTTPGRCVMHTPVSTSFANASVQQFNIVGTKISVSTPTTIYLCVQVGFAVNTCGAYGILQARRVAP